MHHPTDRITHTTAFVTPVVEHWLEREIAQWVRLNGVALSIFGPDTQTDRGCRPYLEMDGRGNSVYSKR